MQDAREHGSGLEAKHEDSHLLHAIIITKASATFIRDQPWTEELKEAESTRLNHPHRGFHHDPPYPECRHYHRSHVRRSPQSLKILFAPVIFIVVHSTLEEHARSSPRLSRLSPALWVPGRPTIPPGAESTSGPVSRETGPNRQDPTWAPGS